MEDKIPLGRFGDISDKDIRPNEQGRASPNIIPSNLSNIGQSPDEMIISDQKFEKSIPGETPRSMKSKGSRYLSWNL